MTNTYCKNTAASKMFGLQSSEESTASYAAPRDGCTSFTHQNFFILFSNIKSEKTHIHMRTHPQHTARVLYREGLKLVRSSLSPDKLINTINGLIYTLGLKFDTWTLSWLRKHKRFCARGFNGRSVI